MTEIQFEEQNSVGTESKAKEKPQKKGSPKDGGSGIAPIHTKVPAASRKTPYSLLFRIPRALAAPWIRPYRLRFTMPDAPTVFLARHGNMQGPFRTLTAKGMRARPCVLSVFHSYRECFRQYADYTFSRRFGMPRPLAVCLAALAACFVVPVVRGLAPIPVYRGQTTAGAKTVKKSVEALLSGEHVIVYPDKDYTASDEKSRELYHGFLLFERLYYRKTGCHLPFVVLTLDERTRTVERSPVISFKDGEDFAAGASRVLAEVTQAMYRERFY